MNLEQNFNRKNYSDDTLLGLYTALLKPRLIEEKMLILLRQGKISKWFSGIGQEAISVGATEALESDEYILTMHRNLGVFTSRNVPLYRLFSQWQGKTAGYTQGRDRSFHFGTNEHHIVGMISHLGAQLAVGNGIALANKLKKFKKVALAFTGDGATSEGDFHEAMNVASVWQLPIIFVIENNGYGLSTPNNEQFRCAKISDRAKGYGMESIVIEGNNILEVYDTILNVSKYIKNNPQPIMVECLTFRMRGHEEASGTKYVPQELMNEWQKKDPILTYENYLKKLGILTDKKIEKLRADIKNQINEGLKKASNESFPDSDTEREESAMYSPFTSNIREPNSLEKSKKRFIDALSDSLHQNLQKYPNLILMGQDIAEYGGVFKITESMVEKYGKDRIRNTPLCESAIIGAGLGLSIQQMKSVIEMQFADFVTCGFNQIVNNLAKVYYRWQQNADVVIRMPTGAGVGAGPFHSQSNEAWFFHTAGLKIVYPSTPYDAKGLLNTAIEDPNPYLFFEHKYLYRSLSETIPDDFYTVPVGKARIVQEGSDISIITYGMGVHWATEIVQKLDKQEISIEILDLRTLLPWDKEAVQKTVSKTGKVLICHEDCLTGGIGGEISAWISEHCFENLDAPVMRVGSLDTAVPFSKNLENDFLPQNRLRKKLKELILY